MRKIVPLFHAAGIYVSILTIAYWDISIALGIADHPLSAGFATETLKHLDVQGAVIPPSILDDMSHDEEGITALSKLNVVPFGGGTYTTPHEPSIDGTDGVKQAASPRNRGTDWSNTVFVL